MWLVKVRKVKAIYHTMNLFNQDVAKECLVAECWTSVRNLPLIQDTLREASVVYFYLFLLLSVLFLLIVIFSVIMLNID